MDRVRSAREFARKKHLHQFRKDCKTPYFDHLKQVVKRLKKLGINNEDILCAGWLHDTIEDTNTDYDDISKKFGRKVADIVSSLTKDNRLEKNEQEKRYLVQLKNASWEAKAVKLGDIIANIADLKNSRYSRDEKIEQVRKKILYLRTIKYAIILHKSKFSGIRKVERELNDLLVFYNQDKISLLN